MKKIIATFIILLAAFYTVTIITACTTPPPPPPPPPPAAPPPPEPEPPQPEPAAPPDISPPEVSVELFPRPYSPISPDGEEQLLTVKIHVKSASPIDTWSVEIREPESDRVFLSAEQQGEPPELLTWNGRNFDNELVESATVYDFTLSVTNINNETATCQGKLAIDVLVQREEKGLLRIIVPSIIFAPNSGELTKGLDPETAANNEKILRRIAEILGYFEAYRVKIEGHANPISPPSSRRRITEETRGLYRGDMGLQPLSEERAKAVAEYLKGLGVDGSRLTSVGMGAKRVRAEYDDKANWWKNRRVEFILDKPEPVETPPAEAQEPAEAPPVEAREPFGTGEK